MENSVTFLSSVGTVVPGQESFLGFSLEFDPSQARRSRGLDKETHGDPQIMSPLSLNPRDDMVCVEEVRSITIEVNAMGR
jgi:hypothetical protein